MPPFDRIVIVADTEGGSVGSARAQILRHVPPGCKGEAWIVVLKFRPATAL